MLKITYMSDLHLEFHWDNGDSFIREVVDYTPQSDLVVLAGDIGVLKENAEQLAKLLQGLSEKVSGEGRVVYVNGNHEMYGDGYRAGKQRMKELRQESPENVIVCDGYFHQFKVNGYTIAAGTLWFENLMPDAFTKSCLNDFCQIPGLEEDIYRENNGFVTMLKGVLSREDKVVVVTHHSPSYRSVNPLYAGSHLNQFFCNNLDDLIEEGKPLCWFFGHLHDPVDYQIGLTRILSNPAGYKHEMSADWAPKTIVIN
jgi:predicted MPP superfamily phosphohydrolase